ncbi:hypothetical protein XENOCAPTIV_002928 [Xenoophorus captivus]|uniref:Protein BCCIP homolog n=1 Tax=Xenoophorus captivus TaxID=1517983 RepID=A0ABV0Q7P0_9TELE
MASSAKKRAVGLGENPEESEHSSDENPEDDDESAEDDSDEEINEVKHKITHQLFLKGHVDISGMTDIIIQQNHVGSVIKQAEVPEDSDDDDPDEVLGFITMLNLTERKGVQCVEEVKDLIMDHCEKNAPHSVMEHLEKIFSDTSKPVGLLLSERFINVPPQIALPLHKQLQ